MSPLIRVLLLTFFFVSAKGLHSLTGRVEAGNYSYYVLKYEGPIVLELRTMEGDADLYVSDVLEHPTYELEEHSLSSWTCGLDTIFISKSFGRPINIGVYGHPRNDESLYVLTAEFLPEDDLDPFAKYTSENEPLGDPENLETDYSEGKSKETKFSSVLATTIYWLLEILFEILTAL